MKFKQKRKPRINQRTGKGRVSVPDDEYGTTEYGSNIGFKQNMACLDCKYLARQFRPWGVAHAYANSPQLCPHCRKPLQAFGIRFRFPRKGRWKKDPQLKTLLK